MKKYDIRYIKKVPVWAYAEVKAENIDDALEMLERSPERYTYEIDITNTNEAPGIEDDEFELAEILTEEKEWVELDRFEDTP